MTSGVSVDTRRTVCHKSFREIDLSYETHGDLRSVLVSFYRLGYSGGDFPIPGVDPV